MTKNVFKKISLGLASLLFAAFANAQALYVEGEHYHKLANPLPLQEAGKKEVVEFFSYACPHCYNLEPHIVNWAKEKKPEDVAFYQIPATGGGWDFPAQVKYTAEKLGLGFDFDQKIFDLIHKSRKTRLLGAKEEVFKLFKEFNVTEEQAETAWNSLQVKTKLNQARKLWDISGLKGVPSVVVNGQYAVQLTTLDQFFNTIDYLLKTTSPLEATAN